MKTWAEKKERKKENKNSCNLFDNNNERGRGTFLRGSISVLDIWNNVSIVNNVSRFRERSDRENENNNRGTRRNRWPREKARWKFHCLPGYLLLFFGEGVGVKLETNFIALPPPFRSRMERSKYYKPGGKLSREIIKLGKILSSSYFKISITPLFFPWKCVTRLIDEILGT